MATWIDTLRELLCAIYRQWGGDCADLNTTPNEAAAIVLAAFNANGAPTFSNPTDAETFLANLSQLEECILDPSSTLSIDIVNQLLTMIGALKKSIKP